MVYKVWMLHIPTSPILTSRIYVNYEDAVEAYEGWVERIKELSPGKHVELHEGLIDWHIIESS